MRGRGRIWGLNFLPPPLYLSPLTSSSHHLLGLGQENDDQKMPPLPLPSPGLRQCPHTLPSALPGHLLRSLFSSLPHTDRWACTWHAHLPKRTSLSPLLHHSSLLSSSPSLHWDLMPARTLFSSLTLYPSTCPHLCHAAASPTTPSRTGEWDGSPVCMPAWPACLGLQLVNTTQCREPLAIPDVRFFIAMPSDPQTATCLHYFTHT